MIWLSLISNPWVIRIVVVVVAVIGLYGYGHHKGWTARDAEMQAAIAEANEKARATEQKLTEQIGEQSNKLKEANDAVTEKQSALDRAIRAGRVRLPTSSCVSTAQGAAAPSGHRYETGSQSDRAADQPSDAERATLAAIAEIVAQGDRNTAQLNACIDAYNAVREQINGQR